jgi:hypothetical protein
LLLQDKLLSPAAERLVLRLLEARLPEESSLVVLLALLQALQDSVVPFRDHRDSLGPQVPLLVLLQREQELHCRQASSAAKV